MLTKTIQLYEDRNDVTLTAYILEDSPSLLAGKSRPAVIVCPGGAYLFCSDSEAEPVATRFNAMGYHAFVLRYATHSGSPGHLPKPSELAVNPNCLYPAPMRDIGKAFLHIRDNAASWHVDTDRIALCGFSAGGHNCAMYGVNWQEPVISAHFGEPSEVFKPAALILGYAVIDFNRMLRKNMEQMVKSLLEASYIAYFGTKTPVAEQMVIANPALHVTKELTPPVFLWTTADDELVPAENTLLMASALARAGVPFEAHVFEHGMHGLSLSDQSSAASLVQADDKVAKWVELAETWLKKRFALPLPEKPQFFDEATK